MAEVPGYVAPIALPKTFGQAIQQGTAQLGPLLAQTAKDELARDKIRREAKNAQLKSIKGYDVSNWADHHIEAYDALKAKTTQLISLGDPKAGLFIDSLTRYGDFFDQYATETIADREKYENGLIEPGSLDTEDLEFVGNMESLLENDTIRELGGFGKFDISEDGKILGVYLNGEGKKITDENGLELNEMADIFNAPGITKQNYYGLDFQVPSNLPPQEFSKQFVASANELINSNLPSDEVESRIREAIGRAYDISKRAQRTASGLYADLEQGVEGVSARDKYIEETLSYIGFERLSQRSTKKKLAVDVIQNRTLAQITQPELQSYQEFAGRLGPNQEATGNNYVLTELEKGKGLDLPNPEYDPNYKESPYDDATKIRLKKTPIINEKVRTAQVYPQMGLLVLKGGIKGEYKINYVNPNEEEQDILEQLRQALNEAYEGQLTLEQLLDSRGVRNVSFDQGEMEQEARQKSPSPSAPSGGGVMSTFNKNQ